MSRNCPSCGAELSDTAKFCRGCGGRVGSGEETPKLAALDLARQTCPACATELVPGARFCHMCAAEAPPPPRPAKIDCPGCGKEIDGADVFCRYCGGSTSDWTSGPPHAAAQPEAGISPEELPRSEPSEPEPEPVTEQPIGADAPEESAANTAEAAAVTPDSPASTDGTSAVAGPAARSVEIPPPSQRSLPAALDEESVVLTVGSPSSAGATEPDQPPVAGDPVADLERVNHDGDSEGEATIISSASVNGAVQAPVEKRCGACQQPVSETARFCRACGATLAEVETTVLMPRSSPVACSGCGKEIEDWAQFCRHCGARRTTQTQAPRQESASMCEVCGAPAAERSSLCTNCAQAVGA